MTVFLIVFTLSVCFCYCFSGE